MLKKLLIILCVIIIAAIVVAACGKPEDIPGHELDLTDEIKTSEPEIIDDYIDETIEQTEQTQPETDPPVIDVWDDMYVPRYEVYDNPNLGFKIQYPAEWTCIDSDISVDEFNAMILELLGTKASAGWLLNDINASASALMWYNFGNTKDLFMPVANLVISDAGDITQDDFQSPMNLMELQNQFDNYYPLILDGFESNGISGQLLGENYYALYNYNYSDDAIISSCYQAITEKNGFLYTYTFTSRDGKLDIDTYEKMLSTIEFY